MLTLERVVDSKCSFYCNIHFLRKILGHSYGRLQHSVVSLLAKTSMQSESRHRIQAVWPSRGGAYLYTAKTTICF